MASEKVSFQKVSVKYGILVGIAHIVFFLIMRLFGLIDNVALSYLSGIFLIIGIVVAISRYKRLKGGMINYLPGLAIGVISALVSSVILATFLAIYVSFIDTTYLEALRTSGLFPEGLSVLSMFFVTIVHGTWPGFFIAFIAMQWFKRPDHTMSRQV